jgi:hypothetical protein
VGSAETPLGFSSRFLLKFAVGQGFFPYTNILCPETVGTTVGCFLERACTARCEIFYRKHIALWPQNWSAQTQGHRTLFAEVLSFWDSRGKCCERQVGLSRLERRRGHDWALYWQLFETLTTLFVMACDSFRSVACVLRNKASKLVHSLWKTRYINTLYEQWSAEYGKATFRLRLWHPKHI